MIVPFCDNSVVRPLKSLIFLSMVGMLSKVNAERIKSKHEEGNLLKSPSTIRWYSPLGSNCRAMVIISSEMSIPMVLYPSVWRNRVDRPVPQPKSRAFFPETYREIIVGRSL
jgi:hypothetical protein